MGNCHCKPKTVDIRSTEFSSRKIIKFEEKHNMAKIHQTDKNHRASDFVESLVLEDIERECSSRGKKETVEERLNNVHMKAGDRTEPTTSVQTTQIYRTNPTSSVQTAQIYRTNPTSSVQTAQSERTQPSTTNYITHPKVCHKPIEEDVRVESVSSNRSFSAENSHELSARSVKRETKSLEDIENKENFNPYGEFTVSTRCADQNKLSERNGSFSMQDALSKGDSCLTQLPRTESPFVVCKDVNDVSKTTLDTSEIKTASASTTAMIEENRLVGSGSMVSGGLSGGIQQGLRTRNIHSSHGRLKAVTNRKMISLDEKLKKLQKRDPKIPGPDKGIIWPKSMDNLSKVDAAYYVEQFLRSELFRQRCLRKLQGSKTWMKGLSQFQVWVLEHEETEELQNVLHPIKSKPNNAKAKVICWRGQTPPPPPQDE